MSRRIWGLKGGGAGGSASEGEEELSKIRERLEGPLGGVFLANWSVEMTCRSRSVATNKKNKGESGDMRYGQNLGAAIAISQSPAAAADGAAAPLTTPPAYDRYIILRRSDQSDVATCLPVFDTWKSSNFKIFEEEEELILRGSHSEVEAKMKKLFPNFQNLFKIRVEGYEYSLGNNRDWVVRVGSLRKGNTYRGTLVEVEYKPCSDFQESFALLQHFFEKMLPDAAAKDFWFLENRKAKNPPPPPPKSFRKLESRNAMEWLRLLDF